MNKRQAQKQATRENIRQAAKALFAMQGYEATTSRQIAQEAGIAAGTIFVHFPNKQAILIEILFEDIEMAVAQAFATLDSSLGTRAKLLHLARTLYGYYVQNIELSRVLLQHSLFEPAAGSPADFEQQVAQFLVGVTGMLEHGQQMGDVNAEKPAALLAEAFMAAYFFVLMRLIRSDEPELDDAVAKLDQLTVTLLT